MLYQRLAVAITFSLLCSTSSFAQTQQRINIDQATVFLNGAELVSSARLSLQKGENEILLTNVAGDVNQQSVTVNATNGVVVTSATFQNNYMSTDILSPRGKMIKDSIETVTTERQQVSNRISTLQEQLSLLQENRKVGGTQSGLSVAELTKMLDLVNNKMEAFLNQKNRNETILKKIDERLAHMQQQLGEEQKKDYQPGGQLAVKFYAKEAATTNITVSYVVPNAGWTPTYDIWADDVNSPVKLYYKANVYQNSGVKWNNVKISLSTGNPNEGVNAPVINPWYLAFYEPPVYKSAPSAPQEQSVRAYKVPLIDKYSTGANTTFAAEDIEKMPSRATIDQYVQVDNSGVNTTFDIDLPYTIPSDGQQHIVAVKKYELLATYRYFAVPKLDKDAFLQAQITNWEDLNLLPAQTNIFYEGTYVGQGYLDMRNVKDTMTVSLGRDKKIIVKREQDKKLRSVKTIGTNVRETFAYTITVRNTRKENISLTLQDQLPVSNDKDIVIEDRETDGGDIDETTGKVEWKISVKPSETKTVRIGYTLKYPKGKTLNRVQ